MLFQTQCGYSRSAVFIYATVTRRNSRCSGKVLQGFSRPIPGIRRKVLLNWPAPAGLFFGLGSLQASALSDQLNWLLARGGQYAAMWARQQEADQLRKTLIEDLGEELAGEELASEGLASEGLADANPESV